MMIPLRRFSAELKNQSLFEINKFDFLFSFPILLLFMINPPADALIIILSALIHESGHIAAFFIFKRKIKSISFSIFAISLENENKYSSYQSDAAIAFAGAFFNMIAAAFAILIIRNSANYHAILFLLSNLFFAALNLLPIRGMDGGIILYSLSCLLFDCADAEKILSAFSLIFTILLSSAAIFILFITKGNFSLLIIALSLILENMHKKRPLYAECSKGHSAAK